MNLENVVGVSGDEDGIIGYVSWYSIGKQQIHEDDIRQKLNSAGLSEGFMPNPIRVSDAFRRATSEAEKAGRYRKSNQKNTHENILVREPISNRKKIQRNLVIETVDEDSSELSYETKKAIITLDKESGIFTYESNDSELKQICEEAKEKFDFYKSHYSEQHLRISVVSKIVKTLAPTTVKRNSNVFFSPISKKEDVKKLIHFVESLKNSEAYRIPIMNADEQRSMVVTKLQDRMNEILTNCHNNKLHGKKGDIKSTVEKANEAIRDYKEYHDILTNDLDGLNDLILEVRTEAINLASELNE